MFIWFGFVVCLGLVGFLFGRGLLFFGVFFCGLGGSFEWGFGGFFSFANCIDNSCIFPT